MAHFPDAKSGEYNSNAHHSATYNTSAAQTDTAVTQNGMPMREYTT